MKPAPFTYHAPKTVEETLDMLAEVADDDGRVLAGGQRLVPTMAFRLARPQAPRRHQRRRASSTISRCRTASSASARPSATRRSSKPVENGPLGRLLAEVVRHIAHHPIRARGTFCGSIAHADPASEWCAVAAAFDAEMVAEQAPGHRA